MTRAKTVEPNHDADLGLDDDDDENQTLNEQNEDATAEELVEKYGADMTAEQLQEERESLMRRLTSSITRRDWALLDETQRFLGEAKDELEKLGESALEALWEAEKEPKPKDIVTWRTMRKGLKQLISTIESAAAGSVVTAIVEECMELEKQDTLITRLAVPSPWGPKRQDYLAEASKRAQSSITMLPPPAPVAAAAKPKKK